MSHIAREGAPQHIVVLDTNILWHKEKSHPVSPEFDEFWKKHSELIPLRLRIPEVVFGELWFQQTASATKLLDKVSDHFKEISGITAATYGHKNTHAKLKEQVFNKLSKWMKTNGSEVVKTPLAIIDWAAIAESAVWRIPPFSSDSKNVDTEKGFRDALILETLTEICKGAPEGENVVFVCNDYLLRTTAADRLKHRKNCLFFESLPDFSSYINLTQESLTNKFVLAIQSKARKKFFSADDPDCLYVRDGVGKNIQAKFADVINHPEHVAPKGMPFLPTLGVASWTTAAERWWIFSTQFKELVTHREFQWVSRVTMARLCTEFKTLPGLLAVLPPQQKLFLAAFDVSWKATVKSDGRFHDAAVTSVDLAEKSFELTTPDEIKQWKLNVEDEPGASKV